jgi:hypothetical protein
MFSFDPRRPPEKVLVTSGGVQIIVNAEPEPPTPEPPPTPESRFPVAIFVPENQPAEYLEQVFTNRCEQHRGFVVQVLRSRGDVLEESAKDLAQNVMVTLWSYVRQKEPPTPGLWWVRAASRTAKGKSGFTTPVSLLVK